VLKRMLPPNNMAIRQLSQAEGISEATLNKWRAEARGKGQLLPDADAGPEGWCVFRGHPASDSESIRPPIPISSGH
jgi:transposase-like protein